MPLTDFRITSLRFSGGETITVEPGSVLILVGPNNSGKSLAIREIASGTLVAQLPETKVLKEVQFNYPNDTELSEALIADHPHVDLGQGLVQVTLQNGIQLHLNRWHPLPMHHDPHQRMAASSVLQRKLDTETRLSSTNPVQRIDPVSQAPTSDIHRLQKDPHAYKEAKSAMKEFFGLDLVIDFGGASTIEFRVGHEPAITAEEDRVSPRYQEELKNHTVPLRESGDGIRCFVTTLIAAIAGSHPLLLIDEPEAFLYPPQAARLGKAVTASLTEQNRQAVIATHSADFLRGVLSASQKTAICRVERLGSVNHARLLTPEDLRKFWASPLLHSSQAINGMFHEAVIVCESDADVRFYEQILSSLNPCSPPFDPYFVHGGGKGALRSLVEAYRRLGIPTAVIADLDLLKSQSDFAALFSVLGGEPESTERLFMTAVNGLADLGAALKFPDFISQFTTLLSEMKAENKLAAEKRRRALHLLENAADWSEAKKHGLNAARGEARQKAQELLDISGRVGLFLVPEGELEGWWRDGPPDKQEWIRSALDHLRESPRHFAAAQTFMSAVCRHFGHTASDR